MSRAFTSPTAFAPAPRRTEATCALLPAITLLLTIGSLPLPLRDQYTG